MFFNESEKYINPKIDKRLLWEFDVKDTIYVKYKGGTIWNKKEVFL